MDPFCHCCHRDHQVANKVAKCASYFSVLGFLAKGQQFPFLFSKACVDS